MGSSFGVRYFISGCAGSCCCVCGEFETAFDVAIAGAGECLKGGTTGGATDGDEEAECIGKSNGNVCANCADADADSDGEDEKNADEAGGAGCCGGGCGGRDEADSDGERNVYPAAWRARRSTRALSDCHEPPGLCCCSSASHWRTERCSAVSIGAAADSAGKGAFEAFAELEDEHEEEGVSGRERFTTPNPLIMSAY